MLMVPPNTLLAWNQGFEENLKPLIVPERRGKTAKVTVDMVRRIIEHAKGYQGRRIRLKAFGVDYSETAEAVIKVHDAHRQGWGIPIGVLGDCGSANDSGKVLRYLDEWETNECRRVPAIPKATEPTKTPSII